LPIVQPTQTPCGKLGRKVRIQVTLCLILDQGLEHGERFVKGRTGLFGFMLGLLPIHFVMKIPLMFHVVAIDAQQLPVTAVRRVVIVIVILMMDGEFLELLAGKLPSAAAADMRKHLQGPFPVNSGLAIALAANPVDDAIKSAFI
jgi:hypothetical protein